MCHKAEVLATHAEAEFENLVGATVDEVGDFELAHIALLLVDVIVLETDGVLIDPYGLTLQGRGELEGLGWDGLAELHFHHSGVLEAYHDGLACGNHARGVAVQQRQQGLVDGLDAFNKGGVLSTRSLLAARGHEGKQQRAYDKADAADFFQKLFCAHIDRV